MLWALAIIFVMIVFAVALVGVIKRLREGDASRQLEWPHWLGGRRSAL